MEKPPAIRYLVHLPFSIYLGWITVATIVNVTVVLVDAGWSRFGMTEHFWMVIMLVVGLMISALMVLARKDIFFALTVAWAYFGIFYRQYFLSADPIDGAVMGAITMIVLIILVLLILLQLFRRKVY